MNVTAKDSAPNNNFACSKHYPLPFAFRQRIRMELEYWALALQIDWAKAL